MATGIWFYLESTVDFCKQRCLFIGNTKRYALTYFWQENFYEHFTPSEEIFVEIFLILTGAGNGTKAIRDEAVSSTFRSNVLFRPRVSRHFAAQCLFSHTAGGHTLQRNYQNLCKWFSVWFYIKLSFR